MKRTEVSRLVWLQDEMIAAHQRHEMLEKEFEQLADELMHDLQAYDGTKWERLENYHLGCDICQAKAADTARRWLGEE